MLSLCYTWFARGSGKQFKVPTRWSSAGRLNLIGTLSLFGTGEQLEVRELTGSCTQAQVSSYLDTLAQSCDPARLTVVVLDNAPFHKGKLLQQQRATWEAQGLYLRYLPAYCPQLNLIEGVWRKLTKASSCPGAVTTPSTNLELRSSLDSKPSTSLISNS